jgi:hypothetical protein
MAAAGDGDGFPTRGGARDRLLDVLLRLDGDDLVDGGLVQLRVMSLTVVTARAGTSSA